MKPVVIYTKTFCSYSIRAKALLRQKGVDFTEYDIAKNPHLKAEMVQKSNGRTTVPEIFIGDYFVGGYDELAALEASGKLDPLLA